MPPRDVSILVPAYNEAEGLPSLLTRLEKLRDDWPELLEVIVIDDGSRDESAEILAACPHEWLRVEKHEVNRGLSAALATGFRAARGEIVCVIDSDCTYPPERLPDFSERIRQGADVVTASPWHPESGSDAPPHRVLLSRVMSLQYRWLTGTRLYTYSAMFRAYRKGVYEACRPKAEGFAGVTEILLAALRKQFRVEEIPLRLGARQAGSSKMRLVKAIRGHLQLQWRWITGDVGR